MLELLTPPGRKDIPCQTINKEKKTDMLLAFKENSLPQNEAVDFDTYASPYLDNAWNPDRFELLSLQAHPNGVELRLRVAEYFGQGRVPFHLSNIAAATWLQQMGVIFSRWLDGDTEKSSFVDMIEFSIRCNRPIKETEELVFSAVLERSRSFRGGRLHVARFSVQNDSYTGKGTFYYAGKDSLKQLALQA
ncbi:hypothetical protein [Noviherbaspirillum soli]|uniref:hypothetical protein n=1 Tax=Noviherbaspirillum soli TaxID=1064518 RepID=UPI00188AB21F|nr:hypothetical protein [Noviherbaspirillum soli]